MYSLLFPDYSLTLLLKFRKKSTSKERIEDETAQKVLIKRKTFSIPKTTSTANKNYTNLIKHTNKTRDHNLLTTSSM